MPRFFVAIRLRQDRDAMPDTCRFRTFSVRHFKGLESIDLEGLGSFNILVGANDVGKTTVLEALFLLTGLSNLQLPVKIQNRRNFIVQTSDDLAYFFCRLDTDKPIELFAKSAQEQRWLSISVAESNAPQEVAVQRVRDGGNGVDAQQVHGEATETLPLSSVVPGPSVLRYDGVIETPKGKPAFSAELKVLSAADIQITPVPDGEKMIIPARIFGTTAEYDGQPIADVVVNKKEGELLEILRRINPRIERIGTRGNSAYLDVGLDKMIPLNMFGSGMIRAANILGYCLSGNVKVLLIDEIENGLHYKGIVPLLKALLILSAREDIQIFATTHSLAILEDLQEVLASDEFAAARSTTNCYVLARDVEGAVRSYRYDYEQFDHCVRNHIEIR